MTRTINPRTLRTVRTVAFVVAAGVLLFGLWMWWRSYKSGSSDVGEEFLIFVMPGIVIAMGSYLQTAFHKLWSLALVLAGSAVALYFGIGLFFVYRYFGNALWARWTSAYILLVLVTVTTSLIVAFVDFCDIVTRRGVEQIVGRERRGRGS